jgi:hypothetical protein
MRLGLWLTVSLFGVPVAAQAPMVRLAGRWAGPGTFQGRAVSGAMTWEPVLAGRFTRLTLGLKPGDRTVFEGQGSYTGEPLSGAWFDSQGSTLSITAIFVGDSVVSQWGPTADRPVGRIVYRLTSADQLTVTDYLGRGADWIEFGRLRYQRLP